MTDDLNKRVDASVVELGDLLTQATVGRSHFYVGKYVHGALNVILALRQQLKERDEAIVSLREKAWRYDEL